MSNKLEPELANSKETIAITEKTSSLLLLVLNVDFHIYSFKIRNF